MSITPKQLTILMNEWKFHMGEQPIPHWLINLFSHFENQVRKDENKEWREGRRCEICGKDKTYSTFSGMCTDCYANG
jgi:hypothetical protein